LFLLILFDLNPAFWNEFQNKKKEFFLIPQRTIWGIALGEAGLEKYE
jgi:hypothetical protein